MSQILNDEGLRALAYDPEDIQEEFEGGIDLNDVEEIIDHLSENSRRYLMPSVSLSVGAHHCLLVRSTLIGATRRTRLLEATCWHTLPVARSVRAVYPFGMGMRLAIEGGLVEVVKRIAYT